MILQALIAVDSHLHREDKDFFDLEILQENEKLLNTILAKGDQLFNLSID